MSSIIDKELIKYFIRLDEPQKQSLLNMIKSFLAPKDILLSEPPDSILNYNKEIDEAMEKITKGNYSTLEELEEEMNRW